MKRSTKERLLTRKLAEWLDQPSYIEETVGNVRHVRVRERPVWATLAADYIAGGDERSIAIHHGMSQVQVSRLLREAIQ